MYKSRRGFTLIELLVVIAIILILAAILFPVFAKVRAKALQTACVNNLNQLGKACEMYQQAWGDILVPYGTPFAYWPAGRHWVELLDPYLKQLEGGHADAGKIGKIYKCPSAVEEEESGFAYERSYGINQYCGGWMPGGTPVVTPVSKAKYPSQTLRLAETEWKAQGGSFFAPRIDEYVANTPSCHKFAIRHNDVGEILWVDGHVSSMTEGRYYYQGDPTSAAERANSNKNVWLRLTGPKYQP